MPSIVFSSLCQPSASSHPKHPTPIQGQPLQVRPQPGLGWHSAPAGGWAASASAPPAVPTDLTSCCSCCRCRFAGGRAVPVRCNPGILTASSSCRALAALSGISFSPSGCLLLFQGYCFSSHHRNTVSITSALALQLSSL